MTSINPPWLFDLSREGATSMHHFNEVVRSGELFRYREDGQPSFNYQLEQRFAEYFGKESAVALVNGTAAIRLALRALGVGPGDRVLLSAYSFVACAMSIASVGAIPVAIDMEELLGLDLATVRHHMAKASAVLAVHVQGHAIPLAGVRALCDEFGVPLIEDACQAVGAASRDGRVGGLADVVVTSFQQSKQIATGEGGLLAGSCVVVERAYRLADLGAVRSAGRPDWDSASAVIGENLRLTELQAALALDQLDVLTQSVARQRELRDDLWRRLSEEVRPVRSSAPEFDSGAHTLLVGRTSEDALAFCAGLAANDVSARIVWPKTYVEFAVLKRLRQFDAGQDDGWPTRASALAPRILTLTVSKYASQEVVERVAAAVVAYAHRLVDPIDAIAQTDGPVSG